MTLDDSARRLGALAWGEERLFAALGGWVRAASDPALAVLLATAARHHGAHVLDLTALLPSTRDHDPAALVSAPPDGSGTWDALAGEADPIAGITLLLGAVLPGHLAALEAWLDDAAPVRDGPGIRVVTAVLAEVCADRDRLVAGVA